MLKSQTGVVFTEMRTMPLSGRYILNEKSENIHVNEGPIIIDFCIIL